MSKVVELLFGAETANKIAETNLLIVGVGGIGCELLKSLSKSGFKKFTILNLDHIEQTNLNRQFYFRRAHVGQSKAEVGKKCLNEVDPSIQIKALCDSIFANKYDAAFFSQFDIIVSALDNVAARRHLSEMAIKVGKPIVDAGTEGFSGQAKAVKRFLNDCHNCIPQVKEESFAVCTIRNTPERPVHCVAYAKTLYDQLFGPKSSKPLIEQIDPKTLVTGDLTDEQILKAAQDLFKILFFQKIYNKLENSSSSANIFPINYQQALTLKDVVVNPSTTFNQLKFKKQQASEFKEEKLLSISQYTDIFVQSFFNIVKHQKNLIGTLKFEKDDEYCMKFVYAVTSLRTYNYLNPKSTYNKHEYLSFFDCKDIAGKIVPAISSTNSIAAAVETSDLIRIIEGKFENLKYVTFKTFSNPRVSFLGNASYNEECSVCSLRCVYLKLYCDFSQITYVELENYLERNFKSHRQPEVRDDDNFKYILEYEEDEKDFKLQDLKVRKIIRSNPITAPHGSFELKYYSDEAKPVMLNVFVVNKPGAEGIQPEKGSERDPNAHNILNYLRNKKTDELENQEYTFRRYGFV